MRDHRGRAISRERFLRGGSSAKLKHHLYMSLNSEPSSGTMLSSLDLVWCRVCLIVGGWVVVSEWVDGLWWVGGL